MKREHYLPKQPKYGNKQCKTFSHMDINGEKVMKNKQKYDTDKEAIEEARKLNCLPETIHKVVAYKCITCGKWHIGRTSKVLTEKEKEHYRSLGTPFNFKKVIYKTDISEGKFKRVIPSAEQELIIKRNLGLL